MKQKSKFKAIKKWITLNLIIILLGSSIILSVIYIPKFFDANSTSPQLQNITISAWQNETELFHIKYQTKAKTLGDLLAQNDQIYHLEKFPSILGRYLKAVVYYDEAGKKQIIEQKNNYYWAIYYQNQPSPVGIDSIWLKMNDNIELRYLSYA